MNKHYGRYLMIGVAICAMLFVAVGIKPQATLAEDTDWPRRVSVSGEAKIKMAPNLAILSVSVQTEHRTATTAASTNADKMDAVIKALKKAGIDEETIETNGYNLYEMNHWDDGQRIKDGYRVSNNITFKTEDLDHIGDLLDVAIKAGANSVNSPQFTIADQDQLKLELLEMAMKNAQAKAKVLVESVDASMGPVITINENSISGSWYRTANYSMDMAKAEVAAPVATPIMAGDLELTAYVNVVFAIQ